MLGDIPERVSTIHTYHGNSKKRFHWKDNTKNSIKTIDISSLLNTDLGNLKDSSLILLDDRLSMYHTIYIFLKFTSQQTHQRWYLVENVSWADVYLSTLFQRWQNNVETTLIELRRFNVDEPMLFQCWNLVENENCTDVCLSTLFQRWQNNVEKTLTELRRFKVDDPMLFNIV